MHDRREDKRIGNVIRTPLQLLIALARVTEHDPSHKCSQIGTAPQSTDTFVARSTEISFVTGGTHLRQCVTSVEGVNHIVAHQQNRALPYAWPRETRVAFRFPMLARAAVAVFGSRVKPLTTVQLHIWSLLIGAVLGVAIVGYQFALQGIIELLWRRMADAWEMTGLSPIWIVNFIIPVVFGGACDRFAICCFVCLTCDRVSCRRVAAFDSAL